MTDRPTNDVLQRCSAILARGMEVVAERADLPLDMELTVVARDPTNPKLYLLVRHHAIDREVQ